MSDRKYRHRGYQDSDRPEPGAKGPRGGGEPQKSRLEGAPRGRTAGGFGPQIFKCARCGEKQRGLEEVNFDSVCARCSSDLHTCTNCKNFDTSVRWECRRWEELEARVAPKDVRNQCTLFEPRLVADLAADKGGQAAKPDDARKAFEALFKK